MYLSNNTCSLLTAGLSISVVCRGLRFPKFMLRVIPSRSMSIRRALKVLTSFTLTFTISGGFNDKIIYMTVCKYCFAFPAQPNPVERRISNKIFNIPSTTMRPMTIFKRSNWIRCTRMATAKKPVSIMEDQFPRVVGANPSGFSSSPKFIVLRFPVMFKGITPKADFGVMTKALSIQVNLIFSFLSERFMGTS